MLRILITTNIPAPYRIDFFNFLSAYNNSFKFYIVYANHSEKNRQWSIDENKLRNTYFLRSKELIIHGKDDDKFIHIPKGLTNILDDIAPDCVIASEYNLVAIQSLLWCKKKNKSFIHLTDGTLNSEKNINSLQKLLRKIIIRNANGYIASSTKAKEKLIYWGAKEKNIAISYLTEKSDLFIEVKKDPIPGRILYVGSCINRKGLDLLFDALKKVNINYELRIVGNGTREQIEILEKKAKEIKIDGNIKWVGFKEGPQLAEEYAKASLFVLPTREDCFALVLLEAAFAGVPIVSSKYADGAYDILNSENGCIVDPYNSEEFSNELIKWLNKGSISQKSVRWVIDKFSFEHAAQAIIDITKTAVRNRESHI